MKAIGRVFALIFGILMVIGGFYCLFYPKMTYLMVGYVVGLSILFDAIGGFAAWGQEKKEGTADGWMLASAIISLVFGFMILNNAVLQVGLDVFIAYYAATWLVIRGIIVIVRANKIRRLHKNLNTKIVGRHWFTALILGILLCVFGVLSILNPLVIATTIGMFMGFGVIVSGANMITIATTKEAK